MSDALLQSACPPALRCSLIEGAMKKGRCKTAHLSYGASRVRHDGHVTLLGRMTVARDLVGMLDRRTVHRGGSRFMFNSYW